MRHILFPDTQIFKVFKREMACRLPDLQDNCIKYLCDVSQNIIYKNDSAVSAIKAIKLYDMNPRTEFTITQIK